MFRRFAADCGPMWRLSCRAGALAQEIEVKAEVKATRVCTFIAVRDIAV